MGVSIQIQLSEKLYLRDPEMTDLGRRILQHGVRLIDELGLEKFTFKKLAAAINSTEASIYRYFENKYKLLVYLVSWYWGWLEYVIGYETHNIEEPERRLRIAIGVLANASRYDPNFAHIDEVALHRIVVAESSKAFLTKNVDGSDKEGLYQPYKNLTHKLADMIRAVAPKHPFCKALALTAIEASRMQIFFAQHIPTLTEINVEGEDTEELAGYLNHLIFTSLRQD